MHDGFMASKEVSCNIDQPREWGEKADRSCTSSMGILFGGVSDEDKDEETLESTFFNEL